MRMQKRCMRSDNITNCHSREGGNPAPLIARLIWVLLVAWIPAFAGMTVGAEAQPLTSLQHSLDSLFSDPELASASIGVCVQSLKSGEYLYRLNEKKSLLPASNMKLFTAAEALAKLGPEFRFRTELLTNGKIKGHTLSGDLIVRGAGD